MNHQKQFALCAVLMTLLYVTVTAVSEHCDEASLARDTQKCSNHQHSLLRKFRWYNADEQPTGTSVCRAYGAFKSCMKPTFKRCPAAKDAFLKSWNDVESMMNSSCSKKPAENTNQLQCVLSQFNSVLAKRCDVLFEFHKSQRAFSECRLLQEVVSCKTALVGSACPGTADVGFQISNLVFDHLLLTDSTRCDVKKEINFTGFRYSPTCSKGFILEMDKCKVNYLDSMQRMAFHRENELIVDGTRYDVRRACRAYLRYDTCMSPIRSRCRDGVRYVYETDTSLRIYLNKLRIICDTSSKGYIKHLPCLQSTVETKSLDLCNPEWHAVRTHLQNMTSHQFYCQREYIHSSYNSFSQVYRDLGDLQTCYEHAYENRCGPAAASIMADLMQLVRHDPYYLRFHYRADCSLPLSRAHDDTPGITQHTNIINCIHFHRDNKTDPASNRTSDVIKRQTRTEAFTNSAFKNNTVFSSFFFIYLVAFVMIT